MLVLLGVVAAGDVRDRTALPAQAMNRAASDITPITPNVIIRHHSCSTHFA
jgi:hypothetical protein